MALVPVPLQTGLEGLAVVDGEHIVELTRMAVAGVVAYVVGIHEAKVDTLHVVAGLGRRVVVNTMVEDI